MGLNAVPAKVSPSESTPERFLLDLVDQPISVGQ